MRWGGGGAGQRAEKLQGDGRTRDDGEAVAVSHLVAVNFVPRPVGRLLGIMIIFKHHSRSMTSVETSVQLDDL